jgi:hypothetical protein
MLSVAGARGSLTVAKWLGQQVAEWPDVLQAKAPGYGVKQWSGDTLAWARAEGCTSPLQ